MRSHSVITLAGLPLGLSPPITSDRRPTLQREFDRLRVVAGRDQDLVASASESARHRREQQGVR